MPKYFTLPELVKSNVAKTRNIDNTPDFAQVDHLRELVDKFLDPLRQAWGRPIIVTSGYRCQRLNSHPEVGGSSTSAHLSGYAADLIPSNVKIDEFIKFAQDWAKKNNIKFDQMIDEYDRKGNHWLHIGLYSSAGLQRMQVFKLTKR